MTKKVNKAVVAGNDNINSNETLVSSTILEKLDSNISLSNDISSMQDGNFTCRADDLFADVESEDDFMKFVDDLEDRILSEIDEGLYSFKPAVIGYDMYSDAVIYDYDIMMGVLTANGYCGDCANTFINSFAFWNSTPGERKQFTPSNIVIFRKEQADVACMRCDYEERMKNNNVSNAKPKKAKKSRKKSSKKDK